MLKKRKSKREDAFKISSPHPTPQVRVPYCVLSPMLLVEYSINIYIYISCIAEISQYLRFSLVLKTLFSPHPHTHCHYANSENVRILTPWLSMNIIELGLNFTCINLVETRVLNVE